MTERLEEALQARQRHGIRRPKRAAVLVPIVDDGVRPCLILTRRTESVGTHKGQVAYPGGLMEPSDGDARTTALREAEEEIGLPRELVRVLGELDDFPTIFDDVSVTPVVGVIRELGDLTPQPTEVARIFTIPIENLVRPEGWTSQPYSRNGVVYPVYYFEHDGETLWGLSAYITLHLLALTSMGAPFEIPWPRRAENL
jgi:8-oxo-dGTP pyrophosphatase MutT (NUDIX family)